MRGAGKLLVAFVIACTMPTLAVRADMLPASASSSADGQNFRYTYSVLLTTDSKLQTGDYFTVFDFPHPIANTAITPANWTLSTAPLGGNPTGTIPGDSPTIPNLTWTYSGPTVVGQANLGNFSIDTPVGSSSVTPFSFASLTQQVANNANERNITSVSVPVGDVTPQGGAGNPPGVPEPSTLLLMGIGLPLAYLARRRREQQAAAI